MIVALVIGTGDHGEAPYRLRGALRRLHLRHLGAPGTVSAASEGLGPIYLDEVPAMLNPGGLWVRICAGDELIAEHAVGRPDLPPDFMRLDGERDNATACAAADRWGESRTYVYDGNSGACLATVIRYPATVAEG